MTIQDYLTKRNELFDERLVKDNGEYTEPSFLDPNGDVSLIKSFNQETVDGLLEEMEKIVEGKKKGVSHIVYLTNPPQYPKENSEQYVDGYNDALKSISSLLKEQRESLTK
jgi:hypothetical protein